MTEEEFRQTIDYSMTVIRTASREKIITDRGVDIDEYDPADFKVTKRQIEYSLRNLPDTIRSSVINHCFGYFNAIHEA